MKNKGFTLLEMIISLTILSVLMSVCYKGLSGIINVKQLIDDNRQNELAANSIISRLTRELQQAYVNDGSSQLFLLDPKLASRLTFRGTRKGTNVRNLDSITFLLKNPSLFIMGEEPETRPVEITYRMEKDPDQPENYLLIRQQVPDYKKYETSFENRIVFPVLDNIYSLKFKYYDPNSGKWLERWDLLNETPKMIFFEIKLRSPLGKITTYSSTVVVTASKL